MSDRLFHSPGAVLRAAALCALLAAAPAVLGDDFQGSTHMMPFDEEGIGYNKGEARGAVARLQRRIDAGEVRLKFDERFGYLPSVLDALGISRTTQMAVFSKTSLQRERIFPQTPRALYFNDEVYVGFIPGAPLLELSAADPKLGGVFYTLDQVERPRPRFVRNNQCLECHASSKSMGVPGHLVRSFATDKDGVVDLNSGISLVNHRTPLQDRWGGWYVTGTHGKQTHRGNLVGPLDFAQQEKRPNFHGNVPSLGHYFDTTKYLAPQSDIVALMVLEHQTHMQNFITRLNYETVMATNQFGHIRYLRTNADGFLKYLLFTEEAPLTNVIKGNPGFVQWFESQGPRDRAGRSLRQFDMRTRMFKYPCSYLIYSDAFAGLPAVMREHLYHRLHEILTGRDTSKEFSGIPPETRKAIMEILIETKPGLPDYWRVGS